MKYTSTRDGTLRASFSQALEQGLAPDGGLYVPAEWPALDLAGLEQAADLADFSARFLAPFLAGDPLERELPALTREAFDFELPLVPRPGADPSAVLELFHGPTLAFKDFGARFLACALARLRRDAARPLRILVATSGDTGGAVAAAFHRRAGFLVDVLFPKGLVSPTQERQLTTWGDNVRAFAVRGSFDDCQRLVKAAFAEPAMRAASELSSANSINLGRLLPQAAYYAWASLAERRRHGAPAAFAIPSGNLGNALACLWARRAGAPIRRVLLAHNANRAVPDYLGSGQWQPRASVPTLASAMDVGAPSNFERLRHLLPDLAELRRVVRSAVVDDAAITARIRAEFARDGRIVCPHTAVAAEAHARLDGAERRHPWVLVATAHPAKFRETVGPLVGAPLALPPALADLFARPARCIELEARIEELRAAGVGP